jgi:subtilase family serine protease
MTEIHEMYYMTLHANYSNSKFQILVRNITNVMTTLLMNIFACANRTKPYQT